MQKIIGSLLVTLVFLGAGCENIPLDNNKQEVYKSNAQKSVEAQGFTDVKMGSGSADIFFGCSNEDSLLNSERFSAKNINGVTVDGVACCGWLKGCTIRF